MKKLSANKRLTLEQSWRCPQGSLVSSNDPKTYYKAEAIDSFFFRECCCCCSKEKDNLPSSSSPTRVVKVPPSTPPPFLHPTCVVCMWETDVILMTQDQLEDGNFLTVAACMMHSSFRKLTTQKVFYDLCFPTNLQHDCPKKIAQHARQNEQKRGKTWPGSPGLLRTPRDVKMHKENRRFFLSANIIVGVS